MATTVATFRGVIHGNIIALFDQPALPDGQVVSVTVQPTAMTDQEQANEGLIKSFGAWADEGPEFDEYLRTCRQEVPGERPELEP